MQLDARQLLDERGKAFLVDVITWGTPGWPHSPTAMSPASGFALVQIGAALCRVDARCVSEIRVDHSGAVIKLDVPSPVPEFGPLATLPLSLVLNSNSWELMQSTSFAWFDDPVAARRATANSWIGESNPVIQRLRGLGNHSFPLEKLGIASACKWPSFPIGKLGLFATAGELPRAALAFIPAGEYSHSEKEGCTGLPLYGQGGTQLGADNDWTMTPAMLAFPLSRLPNAGTPADVAWRVLVNWQPLLAPDALKVNRLRAKTVIDQVWNEVVQATLKGHRVVKAAQPWLALPTLELMASDAGDDNFTPQFVFDVSRRKHTTARLSRIHLNPKQRATFKLRFDWQADAVVRDGLRQPLPLAGTGITLDATLDTTGLPASAWAGIPTANEMPALLQSALAGGADGAELAVWNFGIANAVNDAPSDWIAFGSLEISLLGDDGKAIRQAGAELTCRLRGDWTDAKRDLYPETDLRLDCRVRVSRLPDAGNANLDVSLDAASAKEERLHRDTEALRHAIGGEQGRACTLRIRHKSEPGRNALVEMSIHSKERSPLGNSAFYFQARPFTVAKVEPSQIDDQAGTLIAVWSSDDAEGVQWRLPDTTLTFSFPPQAVGEEMERGDRFWDSGASPINPAHPLRYRFSPPTRLVVRPSVLPRRYNKSPSNLSQALQGAKVDAFVTEMAYPVQAEFKVSDLGDPDIRIAETATFLGRPAVNLPLALSVLTTAIDERRSWVNTVLAEELAGWAVSELAPPARWRAFLGDYGELRGTHSAARANFAARIAQYHLYDPRRKDGGLSLRDGLVFRIRGGALGAKPLLNPLPTRPAPADLLEGTKTALRDFLQGSDWATRDPDFPEPPAVLPPLPLRNGALRAGVLHTIEFASELVSILRNPASSGGSIDSLAFTALGASGQFSAAFDEGRTTFIAETQHGQLSRLIKVRIGRIALLWNRAKHIIVYERTTYPSQQFEGEQVTPGSYGWPILRKTAEYVEPIDVIRDFASEAQKDVSRTGFVEASEFVSKRIYVNGAWGRDLGHGYELPLWNRTDTSGFYPKPQLALRMQAGGDARSRCWLDKPEHLYFYSNTEAGTGGEPDRWDAKIDVDCPKGPARLPVFTGVKLSVEAVLGTRALPDPRLGAAERPRFDLATVSDGAVNLLHGRAESHMLVALHVVSMARTDEDKAHDKDDAALVPLAAGCNAAANLAAIQQRLSDVLVRLPQRMLESGLDCGSLKIALHREIDATFTDVRSRIEGIELPNLAQMATDWASSVQGKVKQSVGQLKFGASNAIRLAFEMLRKDAKEMQAAALAVVDATVVQVRDVAHGRLGELSAEVRRAVGEASGLLTRQETLLDWHLATTANALLTELDTAIVALDTTLGQAMLRAQLEVVAAQAAKLQADLDAQRKTPALAPVAEKVSQALAQIGQLVTGAETWIEAGDKTLKDELEKIAKALRVALAGADAALQAIRAAVTQAKNGLTKFAQTFDGEVTELQAALANATDASGLRKALAQWIAQVEQVLGTTEDSLVQALDLKIAAIDKTVDDQAAQLTGPLVTLAGSVQSLTTVARAKAATWLKTLQDEANRHVDAFDCSQIDEARKQLEEVLQRAEAQVRERVTDALASVVDEATLTRLDAFANTVDQVGTKVGKGIKLAKAIGDMPQLPTLSFNAERAEYVFEDLKQQIDTSPFASRLREVDAGLKELGLAVPARQLLDQIIPDQLKDIDFGKVFNNLGGLDFQDLFKRFRLPELSNDKIKITHGLDKATRSAWVKTIVNADFPQEQTLFEFASVAVRIARMELRANSDVRVSADGARRAVTDGRFTGDWGLDFGGARMATFKDVTVRFDGSGFEFDVSPEKVQLHPSLKFIQEYAKQFQDKLPPAVQVEKDERGMPVGVRASFSTLIDKLPPIPPVTIGPILIASGLGLRMNKQGTFEIATHVALGSKTAPVFVQVSYLGGGFWLEASCTAKGSEIEPRASLGLALGSMRAFNLAGVARGSYSILLFANAEISKAGGSLHAGMTIQGSARILGIANASVALLLEVEHQSGGGTTARGQLDVEIEICWCYTLEVHTAAEHKL